MKQDYELMLVLNPALDEKDVADARQRISQLIAKDGGEITSDQEWGTRRLAYPIKKGGQVYLEGTYYLTHFNAENAVIEEMDTQFRLSEQVLRHLLVRGAPPKQRSSPKTVEAVATVEEESPKDAEVVEAVATVEEEPPKETEVVEAVATVEEESAKGIEAAEPTAAKKPRSSKQSETTEPTTAKKPRSSKQDEAAEATTAKKPRSSKQDEAAEATTAKKPRSSKQSETVEPAIPDTSESTKDAKRGK